MNPISITPEITLTPLCMSDARPMYELVEDNRLYLQEWLPFIEYIQSKSDIENYISSTLNDHNTNKNHVFAIKNNDQFIGLIGFKDTDWDNRKTEIGYWIAEDYQGRGIVKRSVQRLCQLAFEELSLNRIQIKCAVFNWSSRRIPEKLGFRLEGYEREGELLYGGTYTDLAIYSLLKWEFIKS